MYTLNILQFCQLNLNKAEIKKKKVKSKYLKLGRFQPEETSGILYNIVS